MSLHARAIPTTLTANDASFFAPADESVQRTFAMFKPDVVGKPWTQLVTQGEPDENGYYHIKLGNKWQTIHRLSGLLWYEGLAELEEGEKYPAESVKVFWESSHYWELSDTLGYYIKRGLTDDLVWVNYDTVYVTGFSGQEVPTINSASYSNAKGEFNTMFAPVRNTWT